MRMHKGRQEQEERNWRREKKKRKRKRNEEEVADLSSVLFSRAFPVFHQVRFLGGDTRRKQKSG